MHHKHRDHTAKKYEQHNRQADKKGCADGVLLVFMARERGCIGKIDRYRAQFRRCGFDLLKLRQ